MALILILLTLGCFVWGVSVLLFTSNIRLSVRVMSYRIAFQAFIVLLLMCGYFFK